MQINPVYPTEFQTYDAAIKKAYGDFALKDNNEKLVVGTLFSKRYFQLFPRLASSQVQELSVSTQDLLIIGLARSFAEMVVTPTLHSKLYKLSSNEELDIISTYLHSILDCGITDEQPNYPGVNFSKDFLEGYRKLLMPLTFEPLPEYLANEIKQAFEEMKTKILTTPDYYDQVPPADTFVQSIQKTAEEYYLDKGQNLLTEYPIIPTGKTIPYSVWIIIIALKWYEVFQDYIRTIEESQYRRESELLLLLSEKGLSPKDFMGLDTETALALQDESEQRYKKRLEERPQTKTDDSKYAKLIPWMRGEKNLQSLWKTLDESDYIEHEEFQYFLSGHFRIVDKFPENNRAVFTRKIIWKGSLNNLIRMIESLHSSNIISIKSFNKKANTTTTGKVHNLINGHFCRPNSEEITLDSIRQAAHRMTPDSKVDMGFNSTVLKLIRSIH